MNQMTIETQVENQGMMMRLLTAVIDKLFGWICEHEFEISPYATQQFMYYSGCGWDESMMIQTLTRMKIEDEV